MGGGPLGRLTLPTPSSPYPALDDVNLKVFCDNCTLLCSCFHFVLAKKSCQQTFSGSPSHSPSPCPSSSSGYRLPCVCAQDKQKTLLESVACSVWELSGTCLCFLAHPPSHVPRPTSSILHPLSSMRLPLLPRLLISAFEPGGFHINLFAVASDDCTALRSLLN